ncbi:TetR/AcrR family transcriptional regulator [Microlunatus sp. Gsoil 973]|uniref:TetR/AcrR family transcriptional regulator n=1 Tax=Microlunatus sp. Gsoil 973 TaxID=2672569 RepID=UPI0012B4729B|nr:TetR/AcrR family transcriptional regulator [Microlunatus sp. Gsoil 973]QGN32989.1 TetR family transcriptional regulator [Microlunatus sp. Gsoil 973]
MAPDPLPPQPWVRSGRTRTRRPLSRELIVRTALGVLAAEGLEAVTMRRVAQDLDTGAASLYAYVQDKSELRELMLDEVLRAVVVPDPDPQHWAEQLKTVGLDMAAAMAAHPGIARIALETLIPTTPTVIDQMDRLLGILRVGGLTDADVLAGSNALALYVAAGAYERGLRSIEGAAEEARIRIGRIKEYLAVVPEGRLPQLAALAPEMSRQDDGFELGLDLLIAGLASRASGGVQNPSAGGRRNGR